MASDPSEGDARLRAIRVYRGLAVTEGVLCAALFASSAAATHYEDGRKYDLPYYMGGFIVAPLMLLGCMLLLCLSWRASQVVKTNIHKKDVAKLIHLHYVLAIFTLMGCFLGLIFTGLFGLCRITAECHNTYLSENRALAISLVVFILLSFFTNVFAITTICTFGTYFGFSSKHHGRAHVIIWNTQTHRNKVAPSFDNSNFLYLPHHSSKLQLATRQEQQQQQGTSSSGQDEQPTCQQPLPRKLAPLNPVHTGVPASPPPPYDKGAWQ